MYEIFEWAGVSEYFSTGFERRKTSPDPSPVSRKDLQVEIEEVKSLLQRYHPKLQIAFTEHLLPYAFIARPDHVVILDSKSDMPNTLNGIIVTYQAIVEQMCDVFWDYWNNVPGEKKQLRYVLSKYDELLKLTQNVKK